MRMLPVGSLYDGSTDAEATESDGKARADSGAARAVRRSQSREQAGDSGRVCGGVGLSPQTCHSCAGRQEQATKQTNANCWAYIRRGGAAGACGVVGGGGSDLWKAAESAAAGPD